jgi:hypothetical protein
VSETTDDPDYACIDSVGALLREGNAASVFGNPPTEVVDLMTALDDGSLCYACSDPIERGDLVAIVSTGEQVHAESCATEMVPAEARDGARLANGPAGRP